MDVIRETASTIAHAPLCSGGNIEHLLLNRRLPYGNGQHFQWL